jgi:hypothetical protein
LEFSTVVFEAYSYIERGEMIMIVVEVIKDELHLGSLLVHFIQFNCEERSKDTV